ncbi:hypothetical protein HK104_006640, partial [Borealophlyctis nickersoniae]
MLDWNKGGHKPACAAAAAGDSTALASQPHVRCVFKEYEVVSEEEPDPRGSGDDEVEGMETALAHTKITEEGEDPDAAFEETQVVDKAFLKFQKRVAVEPEQVV